MSLRRLYHYATLLPPPRQLIRASMPRLLPYARRGTLLDAMRQDARGAARGACAQERAYVCVISAHVLSSACAGARASGARRCEHTRASGACCRAAVAASRKISLFIYMRVMRAVIYC